MAGSEPDPLAAHLEGLPHAELVRRLLAVARRRDDVRFALESEARAAGGRFDLAGADPGGEPAPADADLDTTSADCAESSTRRFQLSVATVKRSAPRGFDAVVTGNY